jgi:hypothetical protein
MIALATSALTCLVFASIGCNVIEYVPSPVQAAASKALDLLCDTVPSSVRPLAREQCKVIRAAVGAWSVNLDRSSLVRALVCALCLFRTLGVGLAAGLGSTFLLGLVLAVATGDRTRDLSTSTVLCYVPSSILRSSRFSCRR